LLFVFRQLPFGIATENKSRWISSNNTTIESHQGGCKVYTLVSPQILARFRVISDALLPSTRLNFDLHFDLRISMSDIMSEDALPRTDSQHIGEPSRSPSFGKQSETTLDIPTPLASKEPLEIPEPVSHAY